MWDAVCSSTSRKVMNEVGSVRFTRFVSIQRLSQSNSAPLRVRSLSSESGGPAKEKIIDVVNYTGITEVHSNYVV